MLEVLILVGLGAFVYGVTYVTIKGVAKDLLDDDGDFHLEEWNEDDEDEE